VHIDDVVQAHVNAYERAQRGRFLCVGQCTHHNEVVEVICEEMDLKFNKLTGDNLVKPINYDLTRMKTIVDDIKDNKTSIKDMLKDLKAKKLI